MDSNNYLNFDSEQQMSNVAFDQDECDKMLKRFDEEIQNLEMTAQPQQGTTETAQSLEDITFNKQLPTLEEPTQPLQGTTEVKTIQAEGSIQKTAYQKANTQNINKCIDLCKPTLSVVPVNGIIDTKRLLSVGKITIGQAPSFEWIDDDLNCSTTSTENNDISCDVEWIREDKFLKQLLGIVYKYKGVGGCAHTKHLE
ncbi:uncharacterized protein LOC110117788 [Ceratitis capitata]|uniref:uncharacterized protein LOC110117788 n=1 Tax=Ceratitis capitata TaxID=7213 RepID=UPI000A0FDB74|nr:uncharacterized protein LOC110117788 [Ceratitis capitata]